MEKGSLHGSRMKSTDVPVDKDRNFHIWTIRKPPQERDHLPAILTSAIASHDSFNQWLTECEKQVDDDITSFSVMDLQVVMDKRKALEELYDEIDKYEQKNLVLSESFQRYCQMIPPCSERDSRKCMVRDIRSRLMNLRIKVLKLREIYRLVVPLLCHYNEHSLKIQAWIDECETRSQKYIDKDDDDVLLLEHADEAEALLQDLLEQKPIYENCLTYGEMALHTVLCPFEELKQDIEKTAERWDTLCMKLEKCLKRIAVAKRIEEESQKSEAERIDRQIKREAHNCCCHKTFQIVRIAEGKYTFGNSKIVRLVRIHGSSIVVRVGGGWVFLYEFLKKCDPCRAKEFLEDGVESLKKLGLKPIDERRHSYAFEARRVYSSIGNGLKRGDSLQKEICSSKDHDHDLEVRSVCSSTDSLDGDSLGSDAGHACNGKTPKTMKNSGSGSLRRKTSNGSIIDKPIQENRASTTIPRGKSTTPMSGRRPVRRSLVERQGDYTDRGKFSSLPRKLASSCDFT